MSICRLVTHLKSDLKKFIQTYLENGHVFFEGNASWGLRARTHYRRRVKIISWNTLGCIQKFIRYFVLRNGVNRQIFSNNPNAHGSPLISQYLCHVSCSGIFLQDSIRENVLVGYIAERAESWAPPFYDNAFLIEDGVVQKYNAMSL